MKFGRAIVVSLVGLGSAIAQEISSVTKITSRTATILTPHPGTQPTQRPNFSFRITSLQGPGCPADSTQNLPTRLTTSVKPSRNDSYYTTIIYPDLHVKLGERDSVWCEVELDYTDRATNGQDGTPYYRLKLHTNGTSVWLFLTH
jgi:hypothetical protein